MAGEIDRLAWTLAQMNRRAQVAFFATCADALFEAYSEFYNRTGFGSTENLRWYLDTAWLYALGRGVLDEPKRRGGAIEEILKCAPHADDFESSLVIVAQDVVILVDCAYRCAIYEADISDCVFYVFEPIDIYLSIINDSGDVVIGETEAGDAVVGDLLIADAIECCWKMIKELSETPRIDHGLRTALVARAKVLLPPVDAF